MLYNYEPSKRGADGAQTIWQKHAGHTLDLLKRPETVDLAVDLLKLALTLD